MLYADTLTESILTTLSRTPCLTADELWHKVKARHECSIQAVYQGLAKLIERDVITKTAQRHSLRMEWILSLADFSRFAYATHQSERALRDVLPLPGEKISLRFKTLAQLVSFWTNSLCLQLSLVKQAHYYEYVPHVWFQYADHENEIKLLKQLERRAAHYSLVIGKDTAADRKYASLTRNTKMTRVFGQCPFRKRSLAQLYIGVLDTFVSVVDLGKDMNSRIALAFQNSSWTAAERELHILKLMKEEARIKITIHNDRDVADGYARQFKRFFGF